MKQHIVSMFVIFLFAAMPAAVLAKDVPWQIDPAHSSVDFSVTHLGLSKVHGTFRAFEGAVTADEKGVVTAITATVQVASVDTGVAKRDDHLRSPDFFDASTHPQMRFVSKAITIKGRKATIQGSLTIRGITREVTFTGSMAGPFTANLGNGPTTRAAYTLAGSINRQDFGLRFNAVADAVSVVSDTVDMELNIQLVRSES